MKTTKLITLASFLLASIFIGCEEAEDILNADSDDVAEEIAVIIGEENFGITDEIVKTAELAANYEDLKSLKSVNANIDTLFKYDTTISIANVPGASITYNFTYDMEYGFVFDGFTLDNFYYTTTTTGNYDGPRMNFEEGRNSNWVVTGFDVSSSNYILNGSTDRTGTTQFEIRDKSMSSTSEIVLLDVLVDKSTYKIQNGRLNFEIIGDADGYEYRYSAQVDFLGDGRAKLNLNGQVYTIDIVNGEIIPA
ncbi:hypothetical protein [Salinivirga cyanobacteriivorans]